ncbi:hypothetical protein D3C78_758210 [compost metagenome]
MIDPVLPASPLESQLLRIPGEQGSGGVPVFLWRGQRSLLSSVRLLRLILHDTVRKGSFVMVNNSLLPPDQPRISRIPERLRSLWLECYPPSPVGDLYTSWRLIIF